MTALSLADIQEIYTRYQSQGIGSVNPDEIAFIQDCIVVRRPAVFVEIGVASGLSSGFIARVLGENGGEVLHSIDINDRFYADHTKAAGYLIPAICPTSQVDVRLHLKKSGLDLEEILSGRLADMAFIDANHNHPWPTIDTMLTVPFLKPGLLLLHHDVSLYRNEKYRSAIGPKYLFDQFSSEEKAVIAHSWENIGWIRTPVGNYRESERQLLNAMTLPWTVSDINPYWVEKCCAFLKKHWSDEAVRTFESSAAQLNNG